MGMRCTSAFVTKITCGGQRRKISVFNGKRCHAPGDDGDFSKCCAAQAHDGRETAMPKSAGFGAIGPRMQENPAG